MMRSRAGERIRTARRNHVKANVYHVIRLDKGLCKRVYETMIHEEADGGRTKMRDRRLKRLSIPLSAHRLARRLLRAHPVRNPATQK